MLPLSEVQHVRAPVGCLPYRKRERNSMRSSKLLKLARPSASGKSSDAAGEKGRAQLHQKAERRWSFALQDTPQTFRKYVDDVDKGYAVRVGLVLGALCGITCVSYKWFVYRQRNLPLAQRWSSVSPTIPITLIERTVLEGTKMQLYRFALPNPADYAGYEPVSSVRVHSGVVRDFSSISRWFTPVSHPMERGIIEFAIKDADPGRMASRLQCLRPGDVLYLGRWMKEFRYTPNEYKDIGVICSVGGSSVALQLMKVMAANEKDKTKLSLLYCAQSAAAIPFEGLFAEMAKRNPDKFRIAFNVLTRGGRKTEITNGELPTHIGLLDHATIIKAMPPPKPTQDVQPSPPVDNAAMIVPDKQKTSKILVCGPSSMMAPVAGRPSPLGNVTYFQGPFYKYGGILKELGYDRKQVYKFGVSTHVLAHHY